MGTRQHLRAFPPGSPPLKLTGSAEIRYRARVERHRPGVGIRAPVPQGNPPAELAGWAGLRLRESAKSTGGLATPNLECARYTSASHPLGQSERRQRDAHANRDRCRSAPSWFRARTTSRSWRIAAVGCSSPRLQRSSASSEEPALAPAVRRPGLANLEAAAVVTCLCNRLILHAGTSALHPAKSTRRRHIARGLPGLVRCRRDWTCG